jgi:phage FluMu protein Com
MVVCAPALVDVRCPVSDHLLLRAQGQGTRIEIRCRCGRVVEIDDPTRPRVLGG